VSFGAGGDATLLLDTGASLTFIPKRVAKKLGLPVKQRAQITTAAGLIMVDLVELPEISVGGATVKNLTVAAFDIPSQKSEGLLGLDFLNHFKVSIDTVSGELDLEKK
jgi:clan AA aspartic protease (TIGR02281 family)